MIEASITIEDDDRSIGYDLRVAYDCGEIIEFDILAIEAMRIAFVPFRLAPRWRQAICEVPQPEYSQDALTQVGEHYESEIKTAIAEHYAGYVEHDSDRLRGDRK